MDINTRLDDVEKSSNVYVHQAEKFRAEATQVIARPRSYLFDRGPDALLFSYHRCSRNPFSTPSNSSAIAWTCWQREPAIRING